MSKEKFKNKTVLITGGVQGIGFECAKRFVSLGSEVIVTCKSQDSFDIFKPSFSLLITMTLAPSSLKMLSAQVVAEP